MVFVGQPFCKAQPVPGIGGGEGQYLGRCIGKYLGAGLIVLSTVEDGCFFGNSHLLHHHDLLDFCY